jgi:SNF2 family DNA or RNA helicase
MEECQAKREVKDENDDEDLPDIRYIFEDHKSAKRKEVEVNPEIKPNLHSVATKSMKSKSKKPQRRTSKGNKKGKDKGKDKGKANKEMDEKVKHTSLAKLKKEAMRSAEGRRRYMRYLRKNWVSSAKTDKCMDILRATDPSIKTIIFSQFTTLLDLVEVPISREKWRYERYDGSMSADARHAAVVNFTDDPNSRVMLVSLKAGNAGLNLVAASQVIILDPFW